MKWLLYLPAHWILALVRYPLAVVAVLCFSTTNKRHLTRFRWLETLDNDLTGDSGWKEEHITGDPLSDWNRIKWLWRNGGHTINYRLLGCEDDPAWRAQQKTALGYFKRPDGFWLYRQFHGSVEVFVGWALFGPQNGRCKFVCTVRKAV